jgi:hypothetical protein
MASGQQWYGADFEFVAGLILTSTNGADWVPTLTNHGPSSSFNDIAFGAGLWVAVGYETVNDATIPVLATSPNGLNWTKRAVPASGGSVLDKVGFAEGRWIVLGSRWNQPQNELFILTSTDAINWSNVGGISAVFSWGKIHFADGMWMIPTYRWLDTSPFRHPTTLRSTNGTDWIVRDLDVEFQANDWIGSVVHVAGRWIISGSVTRGRLWSSVDGEHWTEHLIGRKGRLLASAGKRLILAGVGEQIWVSGRLTPPLPPSLSLNRQGPALSLWLSGEVGEQYTIEQSADLDAVQWSPLQDVILTTDPQEIPLPAPIGSRGFWRARGP